MFKRCTSLTLVGALLLSIGMFQATTTVAVAANAVTSVSPGQVYMLRNTQTGLYMDADGGIAVNEGHSVKTTDFTGGLSQMWTLINHEDGYRVMALSDIGKVLDVENAWNFGGTPVNLRTPTLVDSAQTFFFDHRGDGKFRIRADLGIFVERSVGLNGNRTVLRDTNDSPDRLWQVVALHTVTYNVAQNGGTSSVPASVNLFEGAAINLSPQAAKTGWEFVGSPTRTRNSR